MVLSSLGWQDMKINMNTRSLSYWRYSPLLAGVFGIPMAGLIRLIAASIGQNAMPRIWLVCMLIGPVVGLVLQLVSNRVLFGRVLDFAASILMLAAMLTLASAILSSWPP